MKEEKNIEKTEIVSEETTKADDDILRAETNVETEFENIKEHKSPNKKIIYTVLTVAALTAAIVAGYFYLERSKSAEQTATETDEKKEEVVVSVKVAKAERDLIAQEFTTIGTVAPAEQSTVSASIAAQIKQMRLLKNRYVRQGDILAVLASQDFEAQSNEAKSALEEARLNLQTLQKVTIPQTNAQVEKDLSDAKAVADNARAIYERRKDLYAKGGLSLKELEASELAVKNAENALRLVGQNSKLNAAAVNPNARAIAETKIKQAADRVKTIDAQASLAEIRAPISGIVTDQFQFQGEFAAAGARLLTIASTGEIIVKASFADTVVSNLRTGDAVTVYPTGVPDERMSGKVTLISRSSDPANRTIEVWANLANGRGLLRVGDAVQFVVSANPTPGAVVVPASAVTLDASNADEGAVMTVDADNIAHETRVRVGIRQGDKVQITEGLSGGETVVVEGNYALPDGTKVEIAKDDPGGGN